MYRQEIAQQTDIPTHFLAKIAQDLAKAGLIEIRQGARGGFILRKNPAAITLLEVVETMIGEISLNDCIARPAGCQVSYHCAVHRIWLEARDQLRNTLRQVSFEQLIAEASCFLPSQYPEARETATSPGTDQQ
jgi:Rrf2 family iron-sulfur cluster assembly transcriptional regulator